MRTILLLVISLFCSVVMLAQENNEPAPYTPDDNECYAGGTMEGRCGVDLNGDGEISQAEIDWAWNCGWYMARFNNGEFGREGVPTWCASLLPPIIAPQAESAPVELAPVASDFDCRIFFGGSATQCIKGNYLKEDLGNDGTFERAWYIIAGTAAGNDGNCPAGTLYAGGEVGDVSEALFYAWLLGKGFSDFDDLCLVI